jgi:PAS domain-containing protein
MKEIKEYLNELDKIRIELASLQYQQEKTYQTLIDSIMINCRTDVHPLVIEHLNRTKWIRKVGYWVHDVNKKIFMGTRELLQFMGANPMQETFTEEDFFSLIHKDDLDRITQSYSQDIFAHADRASAYRIINLNSQLKYVISHFSCKYDEDDKPNQVTGILFEIPQSDTEHYYKPVESNNDIIRFNMGVGFWEYNPNNNQEYWSASLYDIIETSPQECPPSLASLKGLISESYLSKSIDTIIEKNNANIDYEIAFMIKTFKGKEKYLFSQVHHLVDFDGKLVKRYGLIYDITKMKNLLIK